MIHSTAVSVSNTSIIIIIAISRGNGGPAKSMKILQVLAMPHEANIFKYMYTYMNMHMYTTMLCLDLRRVFGGV